MYAADQVQPRERLPILAASDLARPAITHAGATCLAGQPGQPISQVFPGIRRHISLARHFAAGWLARHSQCPEPVREDVLLCISELATNAIQHTHSGAPGGTFAVVLAADHTGVHAEVIDEGPAAGSLPHPGGPVTGGGVGALAGGGLGLLLVAAHAHACGYDIVSRHGRDYGRSWLRHRWDAVTSDRQ